MEIQPNTLFLWPKGQRLTPTQAVMLMLPGGLVQGSEEIGSGKRGQTVPLHNSVLTGVGWRGTMEPCRANCAWNMKGPFTMS
jgi:hypothetical protein